MLATPPLIAFGPIQSAHALLRALEDQRIRADVHDGYGLALVSVWVDLVVWCDHERYWWRAGWNPTRERMVYAWHPTADPSRAARRVALRYADLRSAHPLSELIAGEPSWR
ncbi:hypothetical protein ACFXJ8_21150 [Nonomuraea sp. NPDC059194]|uniref:hypothetical protein n=1 Tax=Nonomuraea sp. NPDC059194 TaxID=3346764 RepID=UPI00368EB93E